MKAAILLSSLILSSASTNCDVAISVLNESHIEDDRKLVVLMVNTTDEPRRFRINFADLAFNQCSFAYEIPSEQNDYSFQYSGGTIPANGWVVREIGLTTQGSSTGCSVQLPVRLAKFWQDLPNKDAMIQAVNGEVPELRDSVKFRRWAFNAMYERRMGDVRSSSIVLIARPQYAAAAFPMPDQAILVCGASRFQVRMAAISGYLSKGKTLVFRAAAPDIRDSDGCMLALSDKEAQPTSHTAERRTILVPIKHGTIFHLGSI